MCSLFVDILKNRSFKIKASFNPNLTVCLEGRNAYENYPQSFSASIYQQKWLRISYFFGDERFYKRFAEKFASIIIDFTALG